MPVIPPTPWADLEPGMQTGDLILFSGTSTESQWIELFTGGMFSHATMLYRPDPSKPPLMWQAASGGIVPDPWVKSPDPKKKLHPGSQLGDALAATQMIRYQYIDQATYVPLDWSRPANLNDLMTSVVDAYDGRPFGTVIEMALDYIIGHEFNISSGESTLYCAALVAVTFMKFGLFDDSHPANWFSPNSYASPQDSALPWATNASFGDPIGIDVPQPSSMVKRSALELQGWPAALAPSKLPTPPLAAQPD